ncbi:LysM peptidoglycan-binding domain-containing protein [Paenibacillus sp. NEAU-GSW1]|uniref:LysM peptidoglycan-binding domain-containing protein n=1 Tax=Paenibacillus sp. NEAU-GSW1 TaxID=2682486 RepID=UPI0012E22952|nr:peptidoglycan-binding protein [Paenibacillus sp. NEAU-GSW1]
MTDQSRGLRFDVYERIHLPDEVAAIDELEEIELVPRIQVIEQDDHAVLKGQLLLTGVYRGQTEAAHLQTLEHWIPVEITLPLNRISRLDEISVEIDNFDVDLLSARTLNITGVLSLRGILVEPLPEAEEAWREEPITVVHERQADEVDAFANEAAEQDEEEETVDEAESDEEEREEAEESDEEEEQSDYEYEEEDQEADAAVTISASPRDSGWSASQWFESNQPPQAYQPFAEAAPIPEARDYTYAPQQAAEDHWISNAQPEAEQTIEAGFESAAWQQEQAEDQEREEEWFAPVEAVVEKEEAEKQELRIGFGSKQPSGDPDQAANVGLLTLLQTSKREQAARQAAEQFAAQQSVEHSKSQQHGEEIEWKSLFLGKQADEQEFRKIRVCIVQRDETLESIAIRYSMNPREILLHNGLLESAVSEGQLLYIP